MEKANFDSIANAFDKDEDKSSDWFSFKEGPNKVRVLSSGSPLATVMQGREFRGAYYQGRELLDGETVSEKWWTWIIDRADSNIKIAKFGKKILQQLASYQHSPRFKFDSLPMPYDIIITATGAGTKEVVYTIMPDEEIEITTKEEEEYSKKTPIGDLTDKVREKQMKKDGAKSVETTKPIEYPEDKINPEDIPF